MDGGLQLIQDLRAAAECSQNVYAEYEEERLADEEAEQRKRDEEGLNFENEEESPADDPNAWNFAADPEASARKTASCFDAVNRFLIGEISGRLFASFFNNELKPLI